MPNSCSIRDCDRPAHGRGLCQKHYKAARRPKRAAFEERFWGKVIKGEGCWEWTGSRNAAGYGKIMVGSRSDGTRRGLIASRAAWEMHNGPIPEGMVVRHHCDNPPCVRPDHLAIGTTRENARDAVERDRNTYGVRIPQAKLTPPKVIAIRAAVADGWTQREVASQYGVSPSLIGLIAHGKIWTRDGGTICSSEFTRSAATRRGRSGIRNVTWHNQANKWFVQIRMNGKSYTGGLHADIESAAAAAAELRTRLEQGTLA